MACAHSMQPGPCSSCMQAVAKRVKIIDCITLVDGIPVPAGDAYAMPQGKATKHRYGRRARK